MNTGIWPIDSYILFLGRVQRRENCKIKHLILASFFLILSLGLDLFRALSCSKGSLTLVIALPLRLCPDADCFGRLDTVSWRLLEPIPSPRVPLCVTSIGMCEI